MGLGGRGVVGDRWSQRILGICALGSAMSKRPYLKALPPAILLPFRRGLPLTTSPRCRGLAPLVFPYRPLLRGGGEASAEPRAGGGRGPQGPRRRRG